MQASHNQANVKQESVQAFNPTASSHATAINPSNHALASSHDFCIHDMPSALEAHNLSTHDYKQILAILGREPNLIELGIFSAMWSEHCSYKSSKIYLKGFPTKAPWVIQGPGENAGVIDIGGGYAAVFKVESHNHPSFIEPYAGAATGVGGIMRDIFTMGARPVASLDSIRFGEAWRADSMGEKHRALLAGVVAGIGDYGNCMGVPTIGGETSFEACYNGNILVNAFCLGIVKTSQIFYAQAQGAGNPVLYVGSKTGRDGLGGAVMSSQSFNKDSTSLRPTVQVGDPFTQKLLLEACLELFAQELIIGIQDMGAAGLTSASVEMAGRSGSGMRLDLDKVPMRESHMNAYELMLSESQERMLICAKKGKEQQIKDIFTKWDLSCEVIGEVTQNGHLELCWEGEKVANIPIAPITELAPMLHLPTQKPPYIDTLRQQDPLKSIQNATASLPLTDIFRIMLGSIDICDKEWIYRQYDSSVQTNTIIASGQGDGSVIYVKENNIAIGASIYAPIRYCYLNPQEGAKIAVARAGRKCVTRGVKPLAISDCLNFGNPNNPHVMWQFKETCEGIKHACAVLETPVISGNVSLYNQSQSTTKIHGQHITTHSDIYPSPTIASVGIAKNPSHVIDSSFCNDNAEIVLLGEIGEDFGGSVIEKLAQMGEFSAHMYPSSVSNAQASPFKPLSQPSSTQDPYTLALHHDLSHEASHTQSYAYTDAPTSPLPQGDTPPIDLNTEKRLWELMLIGIEQGIITSAKDIGEGGLAIALGIMAILGKKGCSITIAMQKREMLFSQSQSCILIECSNYAYLEQLALQHGIPCARLGRIHGDEIHIALTTPSQESSKQSNSDRMHNASHIQTSSHAKEPYEHIRIGIQEAGEIFYQSFCNKLALEGKAYTHA